MYFMNSFFYNYYWLALIPLVVAMIASANVKSTFSKYSRVSNSRHITGERAARMILDANGLYNVGIEMVSGELSDHFDPSANVVRLSESTYAKSSAAAVGVAAHEVGHAIQYARDYSPMKLRHVIIPITNIGSSLSYPLVIIGLIINSQLGGMLINIGIILFLTVVIFQFTTLFVEFDASSRAMKTLESDHILEGSELKDARKVLTAAALTYVAALFTALMNLIRLLLIASRKGRR